MIRIKLDVNKLESIKNILEQNCNEPIDIFYDKMKEAIWYRNNSQTELYIASYYSKNLVLKRIQLDKTNIGDGTKIITQLIQYAKQNGFNLFTIECVSTKEMDNLCNKLNLIPVKSSGVYINDIFYGNYELSL